jgi:hypothetical protein
VLDEFMLAITANAIRSLLPTQRAVSQSPPYRVALSIVFADQNVGIKEVSGRVRLVSLIQTIWTYLTKERAA